MQFITGSQLGIHKVIGTWKHMGEKHWHVQGGGGVVGGMGGFGHGRRAQVCDGIRSGILISADATAQV